MDSYPVQKIAFFGGTFDPIHFGHLSLALDLLEKRGLDEVWFCPTFHNPLKGDPGSAPIKKRMEMVRLAVEPFPRFRVLELEAQEQRAAYTVETLRFIRDQLPKSAELFLILGEDAIARFDEWKEPHEVIGLAQLLIGSRMTEFSLPEDPVLRAAIEKGFCQTRLLEISATEIRHRLKQGLPCHTLVSAAVLDYIATQCLYV